MTKCCKPIQCMVVPNGRVECICELRFDEQERFMFDLVAQEHPGAIATEVDLYSFSQSLSVIDPLYGEAVTRAWQGPYRLKGVFTGVDPAVETRDLGRKESYAPSLWMARADLEAAGAPSPVEGDVIRVWKLPYWDRASVATPPNDIDGFYFNITLITEDGIIFDTPQFVGFNCTLSRNTEFTPERRVYNR